VGREVVIRANDWGLQVEKGRLVLAGGLYVPYRFYARPAQHDTALHEPVPVLLALHERGIAGVSSAGAWMETIPHANIHIMAIDVAGTGETRLQAEREDNDGYEAALSGAESVWARRGLNTGVNLFGLAVFSVLKTLEYLKTRWDVDKKRIFISGTGRGALWGMYAAALDKDVARVALLRGLSSYGRLIDRCRNNHHFSIYLPGCLKSFDLPHVAACIAPRPMLLINAVDQRKERRLAEAIREEYAFTAEMYRLLGASKNFVAETSDSAPETLEKVLALLQSS
jgi:hypothetical protein